MPINHGELESHRSMEVRRQVLEDGSESVVTASLNPDTTPGVDIERRGHATGPGEGTGDEDEPVRGIGE